MVTDDFAEVKFYQLFCKVGINFSRVTSMNIFLENKVTSNKMVASDGLSKKFNHSECGFLEKLSYSEKNK